MTGRGVVVAPALAAALALAGCPLPQPLAEVARTPDGGNVSTPILMPDTASPAGSAIYVTRNCAGGAQFALGISSEDLDTTESVDARWFVNYRPDNTGYRETTSAIASPDPADPTRTVQPFTFVGYTAGTSRAAGEVDVVDVVISNGFLALSDLTQPFQRAAAPPYVTQSYRWVFQYLDAADPRRPQCP